MDNLTIRGHDLTGMTDPQQLAVATKKMGIHNLQLALGASFPQLNSSGEALNPGMGTYFKNLFQQHEIQIALLSCYSNLIHPDPVEREKILRKFESYLQHAKFFGASMVASETGSVIPELGYSTDNFRDEVFADLVTVIKRLTAKGGEYGTLVGIEAGLNHPLSSVARTKELVTAVDSPYLGIILDPTNLVTAVDHTEMVPLVEEAFAAYGEKICALHLKDYQIVAGKIQPVPLGDGLIEYQKILAIVERYKPYCYVVLEETKDAGILQARKLLEKNR